MGRPDDIRPSRPWRLDRTGDWAGEADVVVVGLGCAGACAAIAAREAGAEVLVLERAGAGGGTSALSGGLIYLGGGTPLQQACGFEDSPENMFRFLTAALGPAADERRIAVFCDHSVGHFHWLVDHGVPFKAAFYPEPGTEPPTDDGLVYSGGEDAHPFCEIARPAPRAHKPRTPGAAGAFLMRKLLAAVERGGARIVTDARCETLVTDSDGAVHGVVARIDGRPRPVRARRGVILAAGGFTMNEAMVAWHCPQIAPCSYKLGTDGDDGRAIRMAMGAGANTIHMSAAEVAVPLYPPVRLARGIVVNGHGQRFINEDTYYGRIAQHALFRHDGVMYLVVDSAIYEVNAAGMQAAFVEETIADLGRAMGLPRGSLEHTVEHYNAHAARGEDPLFHKRAEFLRPLDRPPFGAIDCRVGHCLYATFTLGGLHTTPDGEVLAPDGQRIDGLYAAGRTASGLAAYGYCSGISLGDATFFGRRAGAAAARRRG